MGEIILWMSLWCLNHIKSQSDYIFAENTLLDVLSDSLMGGPFMGGRVV